MAQPPEYNPEAAWEQQRNGNLATALARVQAELPRVSKDKTAEVKNKEGKLQYTYRYADLADVSAQIMPLLGKHGLAFTSFPTINGAGRFVLSYTLMHASGEERSGEYPLPDSSSPQQIGGWITYARRYALGAVTGVATEEDTDGGTSDKPKPQPKRTRTQANAENGPGTANRGQVTAVQMAYQRLGFDRTERDDMLAASERIIGRQLTGPNDGRTHNNLAYTEATKLRDVLAAYTERGDLLAALVEAGTP